MDIPANATTMLNNVIRPARVALDYEKVNHYQPDIFDGDTVGWHLEAHDDMSVALEMPGYRWCAVDPLDYDSCLISS